MRYALAASEDCLALALNAFAALLISPVSWSHHWVWCDPALLTIATVGSRHRSRLALAAATTGLGVFAAAPQFWFRHGLQREVRWAAWQDATRSSYVLFAALILLLASTALTRRSLTSTSQNPAGARPTDTRHRPKHPHQPLGRRDQPPIGSVPAGSMAPDGRSHSNPSTP
jgi:alpha-1,2-mannosyltransferase